MTFENWWEQKSGFGGDELAESEYLLAKAAYNAGKTEGYKEAESEAKDYHTEGAWQERQGEEYGSY